MNKARRNQLWRQWLVDLAMEPYPHTIPIEKMRGYNAASADIKEALYMLQEKGCITVDYFSGVQIRPAALAVIMATVLAQPTGNFRQVCKHVLDRFGHESVEASIASLFEKGGELALVTRTPVPPSEGNEQFF